MLIVGLLLSLNSNGELNKPVFKYQLADAELLHRSFNLKEYHAAAGKKPVTIAILDNQYQGLFPVPKRGAIDLTGTQFVLPSNVEWITQFDERLIKDLQKEIGPAFHPVKLLEEFKANGTHGTEMYLTIRKMLNDDDQNFKFLLYPVNNPEQAIYAAEDLIERRIKTKENIVVCSSQVWRQSSKGGLYTKLLASINEAVAEGIHWYQAAGNYGESVYNFPRNRDLEFSKLAKKIDKDGKEVEVDFVKFPGGSHYLRFNNHIDENQFVITLEWEDDAQTGKDLDLHLYQAAEEKEGKKGAFLWRESVRTQVKSGEEKKGRGYTDESSERLEVTLPSSNGKDFLIAISTKDKSKFDAGSHGIRVIVTSKKPYTMESGNLVRTFQFLSATSDNELPFGANSNAHIIGNFGFFSPRGPTANGEGKPDFILPRNYIRLTTRTGEIYGTSYSNAMMAGIGALMLSVVPELTPQNFLKFRTKDIKSYYEMDGWSFSRDALREKMKGKQEICNKLSAEVGLDTCGFKELPDGRIIVGTSVSPSKLFPNYEEGTQFTYYLYPLSKTSTRTVKDPDREKIEPAREVKVADGYTVKKYVGNDVKTRHTGLFYLGVNIYGQLMVYETMATTVTPKYEDETVPPKYQTIPEKRIRVAGEYRTVTDTLVEIKAWKQKTDSDRMPWQEIGISPGEFVQILSLKGPNLFGTGTVLDGTEADPRIWKTPTIAQAKKEGEGK